MHPLNQGVVVLHPILRSVNEETGICWQESEAGVLAEVETVANALHELGIPCRTAGISRLADIYPSLIGRSERIVFNLVDGLQDRSLDVNLVPAIVRSLGKASTGNDVACLAVCLDKWQAKVALQARGVPTPKGIIVPVGNPVPSNDIPDGQLIVKPLRTDASEGIDSASVVEGPGQELVNAVRRVHQQFSQPALVEQFIDGREVNVSILQHRSELEVLPLAEIEFSAFPQDKPRILDYAAKWLPGTFEYRHTWRKIPAELPPEVADEVRRLALAAWEATGCRHYARVDFRLDHQGQPFVLEVNPNPDIGPGSGFAAALAAAGISDERFVHILLSATLLEEFCEEI